MAGEARKFLFGAWDDWPPPPRPPMHLRIAVSGHRRSPLPVKGRPPPAEFDFGAVERTLAAIFEDAGKSLSGLHGAEKYKGLFDASPPALTLLSALAQGSDQLAVRAFETQAAAAQDGVVRRFEAVLPFDEDEYEKKILAADDRYLAEPSEAQRAAVFAMRAQTLRADAALVLAERRSGYKSHKSDEERANDRWVDQKYALAGDVLIRQADILAVVWDGVPTSALGGTAYVLGAALRERLPVIWIEPVGGTAKVLLPDHGDGDRVVAARTRGTLYDKAEMAKLVERLLAPPKLKGEHGRSKEEDMRRFFGAVSGGGTVCTWSGEPVHERAKWQTEWSAYKWLLWLAGAEPDFDAGPRPDPAKSAKYREIQEDLEHVRLSKKRPSLLEPFDVAWVKIAYHVWQKAVPEGASKAPGAKKKDPWAEEYGLHHSLKTEAPQPAWRAAGVLREIWGHADAAATRLSHQYRSAYVLTFVLGAIAVWAGLSSQVLDQHWKVAAVFVELLCLIAAAGFFLFARWLRYHDRYIDARDLAEQMRPAWVLAQLGLGGRRSVGPNPVWPVWAAQAWAGAIGVPDLRADAAALGRVAQNVLDAVVYDQIHYHRRNHVRLKLLHEWLNYWSSRLLLMALIVAAAFVLAWLAGTIAGGAPWEAPKWVKAAATIAGAGFPAMAAALAAIKFQGDFERFSERSKATFEDLVKVEIALIGIVERSKTPSGDGVLFNALRDVLLRLENVLVSDFQDWRFVYTARPPEM